ncbi:MAG: glycosyltransferase family 2 protein [Muribaculaceae bacterium]|nr:glycosyltransferase family 2 protein [Muribaculaceae bacterium]
MDVSAPILTVVIPVYNREEKVRGVLACLSAQTSRRFKVILVDNASTDGTLNVLREWAVGQLFDVRVLSESCRGAAAARQCGLDAVDTEWTLFFDSDDTMEAGHISRVVSAIGDNEDAELIGWDIKFHYIDGRCVVKPFVASQYRSLFDGTMGTQRYCARTSLFRRSGGWDKEVGLWDDIELGARLLALKPKTMKLEGDPTVSVFLGDDSISLKEDVFHMEEADVALRKIAATVGAKGRDRCALKKIILAARTGGCYAYDMFREILGSTRGGRRLLLTLAYHYVRMGGRGIARILRPFFE